MVDAVAAHRIEEGSVRIGTHEHYRTLENGRGDHLDSGLVLKQDRWPFLGGNEEDAEIMQQTGLGRLAPGGIAEGIQIHRVCQPMYIFCMTRVGCAYDPDERIPRPGKAVFEVLDPEFLARNLIIRNESRFSGRFGLRWVQYQERELDLRTHVKEQPDPYIKSLRFQPEQELRIAFEPRPGTRCEMFDTAPDADIAAFFTRVIYPTMSRFGHRPLSRPLRSQQTNPDQPARPARLISAP